MEVLSGREFSARDQEKWSQIEIEPPPTRERQPQNFQFERQFFNRSLSRSATFLGGIIRSRAAKTQVGLAHSALKLNGTSFSKPDPSEKSQEKCEGVRERSEVEKFCYL